MPQYFLTKICQPPPKWCSFVCFYFSWFQSSGKKIDSVIFARLMIASVEGLVFEFPTFPFSIILLYYPCPKFFTVINWNSYHLCCCGQRLVDTCDCICSLIYKQELGNTCIRFPETWDFTRKWSTHSWTSQGFSLSRQTRVQVSLASTKRWGLLSNNAIHFIIFFQVSCQPGQDKSFLGYRQLTWECYWTFDTPLVYLCLSCHQEWVLEA